MSAFMQCMKAEWLVANAANYSAEKQKQDFCPQRE